jgi:ribosomal protein L37E
VGIIELKHFKISCDRCSWTMVTVDTISATKPEGWEYVRVGPCGMTDYYRSDLLCSTCFFEHEHERKEQTARLSK